MSELAQRAKERLSLFIDYIGLSTSAFEKQCGLSNGYIRNFKGNLGGKKLEDILSSFPELRREWLLHGEGEMLKTSSAAQSDSQVTAPVIPVDEPPDAAHHIGVPYYDIDFLGTFDLSKWEGRRKPKCWINFAPYNEATCWCTVTGHAMEPEINSGDIIALKEIKDFSILSYGEIYAIVANNGVRFVKRVGSSKKDGCISLIPSNKNYESQDLPVSAIRCVYAVLGCMKKL